MTDKKKAATVVSESPIRAIRIAHPFRVGLIGTLGVGLGILLIAAVTSLATILTYIGAALFLSLGLDPAVTWLEKKRFPRWAAILTVVVVVLAAFTVLLLSVIPLVVEQVSGFIKTLPALIETIKDSHWIANLDAAFGGVIDFEALLKQVQTFISDPANISKFAGGALSIGVSIANSFFGVITVSYTHLTLPTICSV